MARFVANENLPEPVVVELRRLGHDGNLARGQPQKRQAVVQVPPAFGRRGIPAGGACRRPAPGFGKVSPEPWRRRIAPPSNTPGTPGILGGRALPAGAKRATVPEWHDSEIITTHTSAGRALKSSNSSSPSSSGTKEPWPEN